MAAIDDVPFKGEPMKDVFFPATSMPDRDWWSALWPDPEAVLAKVGVGEGLKVVDLCCGDGWFTAPLTRLVGSTGKVLCVDIDPEMEAQAKELVKAEGVPEICRWLIGDASEVDALTGGNYDLVFMANTFHGVPNKTRLAEAVYQALHPGGRFVVVNWYRRAREETTVLGQPRGPKTELRLNPEEIAEFVVPAGFVPEPVIELPPYHYGAVYRKPD